MFALPHPVPFVHTLPTHPFTPPLPLQTLPMCCVADTTSPPARKLLTEDSTPADDSEQYLAALSGAYYECGTTCTEGYKAVDPSNQACAAIDFFCTVPAADESASSPVRKSMRRVALQKLQRGRGAAVSIRRAA